MSSAHRGGKHRRRVRILVPAAAATLLVGGAGAFIMAPAGATAAPVPTQGVPLGHHTASTAQLQARLAHALRATSQDAPADTASGQPAPSTDPAATPTPDTTPTPGDTAHTTSPQIIGGAATGISAAPWMAQLWYSNGSTSFFCGGTVISPTKILTAGHCVAGFKWSQGDGSVVVTGTAQLPSLDAHGNLDLHGGTVSAVYRQWSNPSYQASTTDNDVAVLTLANPVTAKPLPITTAGDTASYKAGTSAKVYGWGRTTSTSTDISSTLRGATVPIDADSACKSAYGTGFVTGHMVCVGHPASGSDAGTVATCNGDSGGPLVVGGKLVGTVSWGVKDCVYKGAYSVFAKVGTYAGAIDARVDDTDLSGDGLGDMFARTPAGTGYEYDSKGSTLGARQSLDDWSGLNLVRQADLNRDGYQDFLLRTTGGTLYWDHYNPAKGSATATSFGGGWSAMKAITVPGDLTGDGFADLYTVDTAGKAYLYAGNGKGGFGARHQVATGWKTYGANVFGRGDLTGDGRADLLARDSSGALWLYKGTGSSTKPFATKAKVGTGYSYTAYVPVGDMTGDGRADLLARDSSGNMWLLKGTGSATKPLAARVKVGYGYNVYNLFG